MNTTARPQRTEGQKFYRELASFCDLNPPITIADLCREAKDSKGKPTARSVVTRWKDGDVSPTLELANRFRRAMKTLSRTSV